MKPFQLTGLRIALIVLLVLGIGFRFIALDRKVYWHDEVYTSIRAAGYTRQDIDQTLFQNRFFAAPDLLQFQRIKPGSTVADTVRSLAAEDPQHPPLYFVTARLWMQTFGSSLTASRMLPALLSLLSLPLMYALAMELFASPLAALLATTLLALSPFDILFAQTARQYGFLTTMVIASSWLLLRAVRKPTWQRWALYGLSVAIGMYTHPFFALTIVGEAVYMLLLPLLNGRQFNLEQSEPGQFDRDLTNPEQNDRSQPAKFSLWRGLRLWLQFGAAVALGLLLYLPWIQVLLGNSQRALATTDWARVTVPVDYLLKLWTLSFTSLFFDLDFGFENPINYLARLPFLLLILLGMAVVYRRTPRRTWLFVLTSILVPFLLLALPDLVSGGKRSAVSRYLISCFPGAQLAVAYLFTVGLERGKALWRWLLAGVLACSLASITVSTLSNTWWDKDLSYSNAVVTDLINADAAKVSPIVVSDIGDDYTNTGDLLSLSYRLQPNVRIYGAAQPPNLAPLANEPDVLLFRPSGKIRQALQQRGWQMEMVSDPGRLWRVKK